MAAGDLARRRFERDLHDGAQQRLVSIALKLRVAQAAVPPDLEDLATQLDHVAGEATAALDELREITHGIHSSVLTTGGLRPALRTLARRAPLPVGLRVHVDGRLPEPVETGAYYTVAEALTNTAKHAQASKVDVRVDADDANLHLSIEDDGIGGADVGKGSGLTGLVDRVEALGGTMDISSRTGCGTSLRVTIPLQAP